MRATVVYCCPVPEKCGQEHWDYALRFVSSWLTHQPLAECELRVVSNGSSPSSAMEVLFSAVPQFSGFFEHDDSGLDIGGFQAIGPTLNTEIVAFMGGNVYFKRVGWLKRMIQAYDESPGGNLFGAFASTVHKPHIRTTGFWLPVSLWNSYPHRVTTHQGRYDFEHRENNFTEWVESQGRKALMATWGGIYSKQFWGLVPNAFASGDQSACLICDRISDIMCPPK